MKTCKKYTPLIMLGILAALFAVYLRYSNQIYSYLADAIELMPISESQIRQYDSGKKVTALLNAISISKDTEREKLWVYGYAFIPTELESDERTAKIIFASDKKSYEGQLQVWFREDVNSSLAEQGIHHSSEKLGILSKEMNLIFLDAGVYRVGIYVQENKSENGICWLPVYIKKTMWGGAELYYGEQISNYEGLEKRVSASATLLTVQNIDDYFYIPGYAYDTEIGANNQNVYIEATNSDGEKMTYLALPNDSKQNSYYPDESYTDNSFVARVPIELMPTGMVELRVILENKETKEAVYAYEELYLIEEGTAQIYRGKVVENFEGIMPSETAQATVLNIFDTQDYYYIPGYAYDTEIGPNNQNIYVEFTAEDGTKRTVLALNTDSTGLDYFPDASYTENSFSAYMPKAEVGDGIYDVRVYIEDQANGAIVYASESVWRFKDGQTELYTGELVENFPKVEDSTTSHAAILTVWYLDQSYYYIPGYAYDTEVGANNQTVYLELEDSKGERITYKALTTDSTGIDYFPDNTYTRNSFTAKIPEELIPDGTYAIRTIIQDKSSGRVVYAPGALNCAISQDEIVFQ